MGRVIGITTAMMPLAQGLGFSIPLDTVKSAIARINKKHEATSAGVSMGVGGMRVRIDAKLRQTLKLTQQYGMELLEIGNAALPADRHRTVPRQCPGPERARTRRKKLRVGYGC